MSKKKKIYLPKLNSWNGLLLFISAFSHATVNSWQRKDFFFTEPPKQHTMTISPPKKDGNAKVTFSWPPSFYKHEWSKSAVRAQFSVSFGTENGAGDVNFFACFQLVNRFKLKIRVGRSIRKGLIVSFHKTLSLTLFDFFDISTTTATKMHRQANI